MQIKMKMIRNSILVIVASVLPVFALHAAEAPSEEALAAGIRSSVASRFPDSHVQSVAPVAGMPGWFEVVTPDEIVYTNADASLLFVGRIIESATKADLTSRRWNALQSIDFDSLPFDHAVRTVRGDGSRKVAVFSDPLCPFCQQLEPELSKLENITVYTFLYPLESIHPGATAQASLIWCAADRSAAWTVWMLARKNISEKTTCDKKPLADLQSLGERLKVNSTPTLFFSDGHRVTGLVDAKALEKEFADVASGIQGRRTPH
jgi:thiol:disulfide interchange protein DsbC